MSDSDNQAAELRAAFPPEQATALEALAKNLKSDLVTRAEFERLEAMLQELLARSAPRAAVSPEELVIIAAAVTSFLGKPVRVRSARRLQTFGGSAWSQQGRVFVQGSHNLGMLKRH